MAIITFVTVNKEIEIIIEVNPNLIEGSGDVEQKRRNIKLLHGLFRI